MKKTAMKALMTAGAIALVTIASPAAAATFRFAFQGDVQSLDPMGLDETFTLGFSNNFYDSLVHYNKDLKLEPDLATSWKNISPKVWRFHLRKNVKFHNGDTMTAEDVIFSWKRSLTPGSDLKGFGSQISDIKIVDPNTIDLITPEPNPILPRELTWLFIMDKKWAEKNHATEATSPQAATSNATYASKHENGTGPFEIVSRQADVKTVMKRFDGYWNKDLPTNVTDVIFTPISEDATRVAALISGDVDLAYPIPVQDWPRLKSASGVRALTGAEIRTIFLGMDQFRKELLFSSVKGKNPLKDIKVRQAMAHAIDIQAIDKKIMRGAATPTGLMIAPEINGFDKAMNTPYKYDPELSKKLLKEAGYPDGFELGMDCPNDRYVNDERICQAVAGFMARVGIKINLNAQPKSKFFAKIGSQNGNKTSFYLLGWTPSTIDAYNMLYNLVQTFNEKTGAGQINDGHYSNPKIDALDKKIVSETDAKKRTDMIHQAMKLLKDDYGYIPLHQQPLSWGVRDTVTVPQRADNVLDLRNVVVKSGGGN